MAEEIPDTHRIELKKKKELFHQLKVLAENAGWKHLCTHIAEKNQERRTSLLSPAYTMEQMQKQNYDKGVILGSEMFAQGAKFEMDRLSQDIQVLEKKLGEQDDGFEE